MCLGVIALVFLFRVSVVERKTAAKYEKVPSMADEADHAPSAEHDVESQTRSPSLAVGSGDGETRPKPKNNSAESIGAEASERDPLISTSHTIDQNPGMNHKMEDLSFPEDY